MKQRLWWLWGVVLLVACSQASDELAVQAGSSYYLNCSVTTNGSGSQANPWNSFAAVNSRTFAAGDQILLKRDSICQGKGTLWPKGSGSASNPITLGAYGSGSRP